MAKSKMENKKIFVGLLLTSLLFLSVVPYFKVSAQSCDPDALKPVSYGQRGEAVGVAQACLIEAGYDIPAGVTKYYGPQTRNAVKAFYADWYGKWHGNNLGPKGIQELKSLVAGKAPERGEETQPPAETQQPTTGVPNDVLMNALALLLAGKTNEAMAILAPYIGGIQLPVPTTTPATTTTTTPPAEQPTEGFLTVEKDPSVSVVTLREGETGKVAGLRFRADNGAVTVKSIFLRWTGSAAPFRVISSLALKDSSGNVLYQANASNFLQDSSLNYYLPISGLNVNVPKNSYTSVFVEVTVVGTLPSGVTSLSLAVKPNDVRGVDGVGIDRFGPSSDIPWSANLSAALAGNASFVVARNVNSPIEGYVIGDVNTRGTDRQNPPLLYKFDVTAKNDNLRVTQIVGSVSNTSTISAVYLRQGNTIVDSQSPAASNGSFTFNVTPANIVVNKDQTVTFDILADFVNGSTSTESIVNVSVSSVNGLNSLGDIRPSPVSLTSENMHFLLTGPEVSVVEKSISAAKDTNLSTTTVSNVVFKVNIKAVGGSLYISTTSVATITIETAAGAKTTASVGPSSVKQGTTDVQVQNGWYVIPEGSTYTFEFRTSGQKFSGVSDVRAKLSSLRWGPSQSTQFTADFINNNSSYWTSFEKVQ